MTRTPLALAVLAGLLQALPAAADSSAGPSPDPTPGTSLESILVTGSRIPRVQAEGPAPVMAITSDDIRRSGFATVSEVMSALSQNLGSLDNNQDTNGFSPGAQAVDLRGLGPNHTLVLVNGRRIADYPQAYGGNSNFTDISNIPTSMIERIEVLSGSASAVYGSDAISGVINFILKQHVDGVDVDARIGDTQHGGGASQRFQVTGGYSTDRLDSVVGFEFYHRDPLWAFQRSSTASWLAQPGDPSQIYADPVFARLDGNGNYIDPGAATCKALSKYDQNSIVYATSPSGNYCGSYKDIGYGTLLNGKEAGNLYAAVNYKLGDHSTLFLDLQFGGSSQQIYNSPLQWANSYSLNGGSVDTAFYNTATGQVEQWQRKYFTVEENGGLDAGKIRNFNRALSVNTGLKGSFGASNWNYEALLSYSENTLENREPALVLAKAQALYLGPDLGTDPGSGLESYYAPPSRLYTPLTVSQFRSITADSTDNDRTRAETISFTINNAKLFVLPAGPVGFAGVAEFGGQSLDMRVDPASLDGSYYELHNTSATGSRTHGGIGAEVSVPVLSTLTLTGAGRVDEYRYSGNHSSKFTFSTGVEYRPTSNLLLRGSYGTGFRAPDLSYLYSGPSGSSSSGTDYYLCRRDYPSTGPDWVDNCPLGYVNFDGRSIGSTALRDETSTSLTYGFVFTPVRGLDITADYYAIKLSNEVVYQSSDTILREEADCRLGQSQSGQPVNGNSTLCQSVESQVARYPVGTPIYSEQINSVLVLPINASVERTTGIDLNVHYALPIGALGRLDFNVGATNTLTHTIQLYQGDPVVNELTDWYDYVIPRYKASYSVGWTFRDLTTTVHGSTIGGLPDYNGDRRLAPTSVFNTTFSYRFSPRGSITFVVDNVLDTKPHRDDTWTAYPFYETRWFNVIGREFAAEVSYKFGGKTP